MAGSTAWWTDTHISAPRSARPKRWPRTHVHVVAEDVLWFDVRVHDAVPLQKQQRRQHLDTELAETRDQQIRRQRAFSTPS
eukprot:COSAG01_NODE_64501_length_276_cov_0.774011_1_plen_80_part_01